MARTKLSGDEPQSIPGDEEIRELDELSEMCIHNRDEIVSLHSYILGRTIHIRRGDIYKYAAVMASNNQVANLIGIDRKCLVKHFSRELNMARAFAKQKLITRFYHLAVHGNNPADRIFALKNWANMSDQGLTEDLAETEEGVEFKIKRPVKPIETLPEQEAQLPVSENVEEEDESTGV